MSDLPVVAITGANGYVGSILERALTGAARVVRLVRRPEKANDALWTLTMSCDEMTKILRDNAVDCIFHAAWNMSAGSRSVIQMECVDGSARLLQAARNAGVTRFIFISTISAFDGARSDYGKSKLEAEYRAIEFGATVLRLGLVCGAEGRGMFGKLRKIARSLPIIPLIGDGSALQYLLREDVLGALARRAAHGDLVGEHAPITLASPTPIPFRDLLARLAGPERRPLFLPIPWRAIYLALRVAEAIGAKLNFRSDSVLSFIYQDPRPDFSHLERLGLPAPLFDVQFMDENR